MRLYSKDELDIAAEITHREAYGPGVCRTCKGRGFILADSPPTIDCPDCDGGRILRVPLPPMFKEKKPVPDWPYFVFWASSLTGLFLLLFVIILGLHRIIKLLEGMQ